jgi:hypothetical protein
MPRAGKQAATISANSKKVYAFTGSEFTVQIFG